VSDINLANKITIARIFLIPVFYVFFQSYPNDTGALYVAITIFVLAAATDKLDGYIARKYNMITNLGKLLDPLADKLLISVALLMLVEKQMVPAWIAFVIIGREIVITALRIVAASKRIALAADTYGKLKLVLQVTAVVAVLLQNYPFSLLMSLRIDQVMMMTAAAVTVYSGYNYIKNNYTRLELNA
jgi:CDP-diacylglycerol--glycerol-3-phosphate 3-phosphatidyltransferase